MTKTKKNDRLHMRINSDDYNYFKLAAELEGCTVSEYVRKIIDKSVTAVKIKIDKGEINIEDFKNLFNDKQ